MRNALSVGVWPRQREPRTHKTRPKGIRLPVRAFDSAILLSRTSCVKFAAGLGLTSGLELVYKAQGELLALKLFFETYSPGTQPVATGSVLLLYGAGGWHLDEWGVAL